MVPENSIVLIIERKHAKYDYIYKIFFFSYDTNHTRVK